MITKCVVIDEISGQMYCDIYRESSSARGQYSIDRHYWNGLEFANPKKLPTKTPSTPEPPHGSFSRKIKGVEIFSRHRLSSEQISSIEKLIP